MIKHEENEVIVEDNAPCLARLDDLAAYAAKDEEYEVRGGYYSGYKDD